jgi:hypothetical protein
MGAVVSFHAANTITAARVALHILGPDPAAPAHVLILRWALGDFCTITDCWQPHKALGLCDTHYRGHRRATRNEAHLLNRAARRRVA